MAEISTETKPPNVELPQSGYPGPAYGQPQPQQQAFVPPPMTTVIVNQPTAGYGARGAPRMWNTGLMDCCDDCGICFCGLCCGPCLTCSVATDMGESCCVPVCVPGAEIILRTKWRTQENIEGSIMDDCCIVWGSSSCAMCQLAREVKHKRMGIQPIA